jgi:hypothetical protein
MANSVSPTGSLAISPALAFAQPSAYLVLCEPNNSEPENWKVLAAPANGIAKSVGWQPENARQSPVTAIDIDLEPDQTMIGHAQVANATLLKNIARAFCWTPRTTGTSLYSQALSQPLSSYGSNRPGRHRDQSDAGPTSPPAGVEPHVGTQHIDEDRALTDQQAARPTQHQHRLLLRILHRHEAHRWAPDRFTDRFQRRLRRSCCV